MKKLIATPYGRKTPELLCRAMDALERQESQSLASELEAPRPETFRNYRGEQVAAVYPKGTLIARCGSVFMFQTNKAGALFCVVYGLQVMPHLKRSDAAREFGQCCFHQAECESLLTCKN